MQINFYINNALVEPPENIRELSIELNYDKDIVQQQVSTNRWRWVRENARDIENHIKSGLTGGVGIFEGLPFRIDIVSKGITRTLFDGYIDLTEELDINCNDIVVVAKEKQGIDFLNDTADSISFEKMFDNGLIKTTDFVFVPYVINTIPKGAEAFVSLVSAILIGIQLTEQVKQLLKDTADVSGLFTTISGTVKISLQILYVIFLITILIQLIISFFEMIIQRVKFHAGMYVKKLFEKGCEHFGLKFQSSIFQDEDWSKLFIIPQKYRLEGTGIDSSALKELGGQATSAGGVGFVSINLNIQKGFYKGTFGEFIRSMKTIFNAKVIIRNSVFIFERRDFNISARLYTLPDLRNDSYQLNTSEIKSNILISFSHDLNDKNTIDQFNGTVLQVITTSLLQGNISLLKNLERVAIPFSLAKRKEQLTIPESILNSIIAIVNAPVQLMVSIINLVLDIINAMIAIIKLLIKALKLLGIKIKFDPLPLPPFNPPPLINPIKDRLGMMILENDFVDVPKLLLINEDTNPQKTKLFPRISGGEEFLTAKKLWNDFHFINSFVEINGKHNQWRKENLENVPFCFDDYEKVKDDNKIWAPDGITEAELTSLKWNIFDQKADISFRINKKYTNNLQIKIFEPDGN